MDILAFTEFKSGTLIPITTAVGPNYAFIPTPLPVHIELDGRLWQTVGDARDAVGRLEQIKGILPDPYLLLRPLQQREALRSSSLEGTYASPGELLLFDADQQEESIRIPRSARRNEHLEVWNHYEALRQGNDWLKQGRKLDESLILELHRILMAGVRGTDKHPGCFRTGQVFVGRQPRRFIPPPPEHIGECLANLVDFMATDRSFDPLVRAFVVHYQFETIHPFEDGNGRVGRLLLSLCVSNWLELSLPWLYLSEYFEKNRREYTERLFRVSANGEWQEWLDYCLNGAIEQSQSSIRRCERLRQIRDAYSQRFGQLGKRMRDIIDMLFERPIIRINQVAKACDVSRETARTDIGKLVEAQVLTEMKGRPKAFACLEIMKAAYDE